MNSGGCEFCAGSDRERAEGKDVLEVDRHRYKCLSLAGNSAQSKVPILHSVADSETRTQTITVSAQERWDMTTATLPSISTVHASIDNDI